MRLRYQVPELFTMNYNDQVVGANLELMIMLSDRLRYFWLMTIKDDFMMITKEQNCPFRAYELRKIQSLKQVVSSCLESCDKDSTEKDKQSPASIDFQGMLDTLLTSVDMLELLFQSNDAIADIWESVKRFSSLCDHFWRKLCSHLPVFKCRVHEFTDAGPGVGVTNHDVQYRIAEVILVTNIDYYIRHHFSNGDSSHNEVERMQSYVGDAICDGGPLNWEYKRQYEGLSDEQLGSMTYEELEHNELERMKCNAFKVCDELSLRIDGAAGPNNYMKAYTSQKSEDLFFNNHANLKKYLAVSEKNRVSLPGSHYFKLLQGFIQSHFEIGEKYIEFLRHSCSASPCFHCAEFDWVGLYVPGYQNRSQTIMQMVCTT